MNNNIFDICVIGLGRVGLPLALSLNQKGFSVIGIDKNEDIINKLMRKRMPFKEKHCQELLNESDLIISSNYDAIGMSKTIIITVGTPILEDDEINYNHIKTVIDEVIDNYNKGIHIILRSTVAPNTNIKLINYITKRLNVVVGKDFLFSYCPERLAENQAIEELKVLPQIIASYDNASYEASVDIFEKITKGIMIKTEFIEAELSKIFLNASRYAYFGIINYLFIMAELYGVDIYRLLEITNIDYPRKIIGIPGFTSGTCLKKDYKMIISGSPFSDLFQNVNKINQSIPDFLVAKIANEFECVEDISIGILGYSFKGNSDDTRDSLAIKLVRCVENIFPQRIMINDQHVGIDNVNEEHKKYYININELFESSDIIIIATNHDEYKTDSYLNLLDKKYVVDIWNVTGKNKVFQLEA